MNTLNCSLCRQLYYAFIGAGEMALFSNAAASLFSQAVRDGVHLQKIEYRSIEFPVHIPKVHYLFNVSELRVTREKEF